MTERANSNESKPEKVSGEASTSFKLTSRVNPSVSFEKSLFGTAKPPKDLLFGRLSQSDSFQYEPTANPLGETQNPKANAPHPRVAEVNASSPWVPSEQFAEPNKGMGVSWILAIMLFLVGAVGAPGVTPLADTAKSAVVAILAFAALAVYFWQHRNSLHSAAMPAIVALPIALCLYAVGSTIWSHSYLGTVEAIRYLIWSVLIFLACYVARYRRGDLVLVLWGAHLGALAVSFIGAMQFWQDVQWFAQGPNPASNFVNRNFAAEYVVMTLPLSAFLIWRENKLWRLMLLTLSSALCVVFLMQTGTRSALLALALILPLLGLSSVFLQVPSYSRISTKLGGFFTVTLFCASIALLGMMPTGNKSLLAEFDASKHAPSAFARAFFRYGSIQASDGSLSIRRRMWEQTYRMFNDKPIFGVGAGAWEVAVPKYQPQEELRELDYYAHNEYLQLMAEYGLLGLLCLMSLLIYLSYLAWRIGLQVYRQRHRTSDLKVSESPTLESDAFVKERSENIYLIICLLASIAALGVTSLAGFPLRLAATGSTFAVVIGCLAGLCVYPIWGKSTIKLIHVPAIASKMMVTLSILATILAMHVSNEARLAEAYISRAISLSMSVNYKAPPEMQATMRATHQEAVNQIKLGIAKNSHYRKMTYLVSDKLASIEDWNNAAIVYDSIIDSRPFIPIILHSAAIVHERLRNYAKQLDYAERALKLRPAYATARSLELHALLGLNRHLDALGRGRTYMADGLLDDVGVVAVFRAAIATQDFNYALQVLSLRSERFPNTKVDSLLSTGNIQFKNLNKPEEALETFKQAWALSDKGTAVVAAIPPQILAKIRP